MQVSAKLNNLRRSPRKVRLVAGMIKNLEVAEAQNQLKFLVKGSSGAISKLLASAISNAENNFGLDKDNLRIKDVVVNERPKLKRWLPRAHGRASLILKKTCSVEIVLEEIVEGKNRKKIAKPKVEEAKVQKVAEKKEAKKEGAEEIKEEKKELAKEREEKEFLDKKKAKSDSKGFLKRVFRRKSM